MSKPKFVYVTYIAATPERVWRALTDSEITKQYWYHSNVSDWQPGSAWEHRRADDSGVVDVLGRVVESVPPRRLVLTWARPADADDEARHTRVTFEIEKLADAVRLTVLHEDLEPDSEMLAGVTEGWPLVASGLKSLLETGKPLPKWW